jgi:hypothetical protein
MDGKPSTLSPTWHVVDNVSRSTGFCARLCTIICNRDDDQTGAF